VLFWYREASQTRYGLKGGRHRGLPNPETAVACCVVVKGSFPKLSPNIESPLELQLVVSHLSPSTLSGFRSYSSFKRLASLRKPCNRPRLLSDVWQFPDAQPSNSAGKSDVHSLLFISPFYASLFLGKQTEVEIIVVGKSNSKDRLVDLNFLLCSSTRSSSRSGAWWRRLERIIIVRNLVVALT
jgi:hypothetical protein